MALIQFNKSLDQVAYEALGVKDTGTLYFIKDGSRPVFLGNDKVSDTFEVYTTLPSVANGVEGKMYIVNNGTNVTAYIFDGTAYKSIAAASVTNVIEDVSFDTPTQAFTFTYSDGTTKVIDLVLESVIQDVSYNNTTKILTFTLVSGSTTDISLTDLVDAYSGGSTSTSNVTIAGDGTITSAVKISADADNVLVAKTDGLYVPIPKAYTALNTATINTTVAADGKISGNVNISTEAGNTLLEKPDGLFVEAQEPLTAVATSTATTTIAADEISVAVKVSSTSGNQLTIDGTGLFVEETDISGKMDLVASSTAGDIATLDSTGQATDSLKSFTTTVRSNSSATDLVIPTEKAIRTAIDLSITWQ